MNLWKSKTSRRNLITLAAVIAAYVVTELLNSVGVLCLVLSG